MSLVLQLVCLVVAVGAIVWSSWGLIDKWDRRKRRKNPVIQAAAQWWARRLRDTGKVNTETAAKFKDTLAGFIAHEYETAGRFSIIWQTPSRLGPVRCSAVLSIALSVLKIPPSILGDICENQVFMWMDDDSGLSGAQVEVSYFVADKNWLLPAGTASTSRVAEMGMDRGGYFEGLTQIWEASLRSF